MLNRSRLQTYLGENSGLWRGAGKVSKSEKNFVTSNISNGLKFALDNVYPSHLSFSYVKYDVLAGIFNMEHVKDTLI